MICPECGYELEDDTKFCVNCGIQLEKADIVTKNSMSSSESKEGQTTPITTDANSKKGFSTGKLIGLIVGTILIVLGLIRVFSAGTSISPTSFGGDFYTYTYKGIVAISEILASIEASLGWVIVAIGVVIDVISLQKS